MINNFSRLLTNDIFLCGDFNIDISQIHDNNILYFIDIMNSLRLFQLIYKPTRIGNYYNNIIKIFIILQLETYIYDDNNPNSAFESFFTYF